MKDNKPHGTGIKTFVDGLKYDGEWIDGRLPLGNKTYASGESYEGELEDGLEHGKGVKT
jgi:MORN repeat